MTIKYQILQGDNREVLRTLPDNSIDAIVTDPPYGIDFLGKAWDANTGALETYQECLRVLKPGGHILAFSAARTYHHLAVTLEQAGFEIRDQIMWIYSSGFPKSQDVGRQIQKAIYGKPDKQRFDPAIMVKVSGDQYQHPDSGKIYRRLPDINGDRLKKSHEGQGYGCVFEQVLDIKTKSNSNRRIKKNDTPNTYDHGGLKDEITEDIICVDPTAQAWSGWGSALKPAHEPIALARKPLTGSIRENCLTWGVGAINIDATRIAYEDPAEAAADAAWRAKWSKHNVAGPVFQDQDITQVRKKQNKPAGGKGTAATHKNFSAENTDKEKTEFEPWEASQIGRFPSNVIGEIAEPYQKYFYCPKVSRRERHIGHETPPPMFGDVQGAYGPDGNRMAVGLDARTGNVGNNHPTVKPIELMKYLIRLITPAGGTVLDPFNGSGSTGCAAVELGYEYIGCELDPAYVDIARKRIEAWYAHTHPLQATGLFE